MCVPQDDAAAQSAWRKPVRGPATDLKNHSSCLRSNNGWCMRIGHSGTNLCLPRCKMSV